MSLKKIKLPRRYNYIACFLTLNCNLRCDYCINYYGGGNKFKNSIIAGKKWVEMLNRLVCPSDLPITIQGGEPGLHPDLIWIIKNLRQDLNIDILTNLCFDVDKFIDNINPGRLRRDAPYPNIRVSYHPPYMDLDELIKKVLKMQQAGFSIGIFSILHPQFKQEVLKTKEKCYGLGIDFRTKEFLGEFNAQIYGTYLYPEAVGNGKRKRCLCRTSELIIGPNADIYRCHHDLYKDLPPLGNMSDSDFEIKDIFRECSQFGDCNPCDIKVKTNRFQVYGNTSVEIKDVK
ncbi:MAG: radical SAM protein [Candidatus Omnitrophica bacterium]|nr:radical SAM protein [Candidatus Omnitrophota bacterium]